MGVALRQTSSASRPSRAGGRTARTAAAAGRVAGTERWVEPFFAPAVACCCSNESMRTRASIPRLVIVDHEMRYWLREKRCLGFLALGLTPPLGPGLLALKDVLRQEGGDHEIGHVHRVADLEVDGHAADHVRLLPTE